MADLLRFVVALATQPDVRDRFRHDPAGVLDAEVDGADDLTGEDVEAAAEWARARLQDADDPRSEILRATGPVRPLGDETPGDAALRILEQLRTALDGPAASHAPLAVVEPLRAAPGPIATGGGVPVPDAPPSLRGRRLWAVGGGGSPVDPDHPVHGRPDLHAVPERYGAQAFAPLDPVRLRRGLPAAGVEAGAVGTVVSVGDRGVEVEVTDGDGGRRFLGLVNPKDLALIRE